VSRSRADDPYRRLSYRRLIAWPQRLERERPFLEGELTKAPEPSLLDLGCGTGEHAALFASLGWRTVGVDRSEEMIEKSRDYEDRHPPNGPRFVRGDFAELPTLVDESFGAALCLGNVLPHVEDAELERSLTAWAARLLPGARLILQLVNYERLREQGLRHLPINFREHPEGEGEIVFVRLVTPAGARHVLFHPTTLELRPGDEPPLEIKATKEVRLRSWTLPELEPLFVAAGFSVDAVYGDMAQGAFDRSSSSDLVIVLVRGGQVERVS
jgi:SAM-dependent methyltransferase